MVVYFIYFCTLLYPSVRIYGIIIIYYGYVDRIILFHFHSEICEHFDRIYNYTFRRGRQDDRPVYTKPNTTPIIHYIELACRIVHATIKNHSSSWPSNKSNFRWFVVGHSSLIAYCVLIRKEEEKNQLNIKYRTHNTICITH